MIKKVLSNAILSIFMNKSAKKIFFALRKSRTSQSITANMPSVVDSKKPLKSVAKAPAAKRQALIKNALEAHMENANVLDDLSEDQKQRLQQLAMETMLGKVIKSNKAQNNMKKKLTAADAKAPMEKPTITRTLNIKRQTLIRNAMAVHKKHSNVLDDLSETQKLKLQLLALEIMFGKINK
jgi:hypothetical protein